MAIKLIIVLRALLYKENWWEWDEGVVTIEHLCRSFYNGSINIDIQRVQTCLKFSIHLVSV